MSNMALDLIKQAKAENWKELDLGNTSINDNIPVAIWDLPSLEVLKFSEWSADFNSPASWQQSRNDGIPNKIVHFPNPPKHIGTKNLKEITLAGTRIKDIRPITKFTSLEKLNLSGAPVENIVSLSQLKNLSFLDISQTKVVNTNVLSALKSLEFLSIFKTSIHNIDSIAELHNLKSLQISVSKVTDLRPIRNLKKLESLIASSLAISDLSSLENLLNLTTLYIRDTEVSDLYPLRSLNLLKILKASNTNISSLEDIEELTFLKDLDVSHTNVIDLNPLESIRNLENLYLSGTRIKDFSSLGKLNKLKTLYLDQTDFNNLDVLKNATELEVLSVSESQIADLKGLEGHDKIKALDVSFTRIEDLSPIKSLIIGGIPLESGVYRFNTINIEGCEITNPPPEVLFKGAYRIIEFWESFDKQVGIPLFEAKMLIVGEGGAGKTSLLRRLMGLELPKEEESTKGIAIAPLTFSTAQTDKMTLNAWDFGGQEFYHATHQFFFTKRALYVLVDDTRLDGKTAEDASFKDWLEMIELLGGDSPVLIFQNEKSGRSKSLDQIGIRRRFPNVDREFFAGDLLQVGAVSKIQAAIQDRAGRLPHVGERWPQEWFDLRAELQQLGGTTPYISLDDYLALYARYKGVNAEKALYFSDYLHDLGVLLHYQDDRLLREFLILRNTWATDAVYCVLDDEDIKGKQGYFTEVDCERLWPDSDYRGKHVQLRQLMIKFELCYALRDRVEETWLAPQLLPQTAPDHGFAPAPDDLVLEYHYDLMPKGMISRLMVRMNRHIQNPGHAWRNGALFLSQEGSVLVEVPYGKKEIHFRARGADGRTLLAILADDLEALNGTFEGLKDRVDKMVPCKCPACGANTAPHLYKYDVLREKKNFGKNTVECERRPFATQQINELLEGFPSSKVEPNGMREGSLQIVRIFLASSQELELGRKEFELFINRENKHWIEQGIFLRLEIWEDFFDAMDVRGLQKAYNKTIRECDLFVSLFHTRVGPYTRQEFEAAVGAFQANGHPLVWTYFNQTPVAPSEMLKGAESILDFQDLLKRLGHYKTNYTNFDDLKHQFSNQLRKVLPDLLKGRRQ